MYVHPDIHIVAATAHSSVKLQSATQTDKAPVHTEQRVSKLEPELQDGMS